MYPPKAALGSPLSVVKDGDQITIDVSARTLSVDMTAQEMTRRLETFRWEFPPPTSI